MLKNLIVLIVLVLGLSSLFQYLFITDELLYSSFIDNLTIKQIENYIKFQNDSKWFSFVLLSVLITLKIIFISFIVDFGLFLFDKKLAYRYIFIIVTKAEVTFCLVIVFRIIWFGFFQKDYNLNDLQYFYPLSSLSVIGYDNIDVWWIYPLQVLNLFEMFYWFVLAYLLGKALEINTDYGLKIVASSYGVTLLIWIVCIMFLNLNLN
jgi:hypothetical protein